MAEANPCAAHSAKLCRILIPRLAAFQNGVKVVRLGGKRGRITPGLVCSWNRSVAWAAVVSFGAINAFFSQLLETQYSVQYQRTFDY
jgi:hypothetical protein